MSGKLRSLARSPAGLALWLALGVALLIVAVLSVRVVRLLHPPRGQVTALDFRSVKLPVEEVRFDSLDGVALTGWWIEVDAGAPTIVLCHDVGRTRASLVNVAIVLREAGFNLLMFDFRGHGDSAGRGSTLGIHEKRDVLGALDWAARRRRGEETPVGVYGVGMGAHAGVLAAADRPRVRVLVLDGLYPDAGFPLSRGVFDGWPAATRRLEPVPRRIFGVVAGARIDGQRAEEVVGGLFGRHLLLVAPAGDSALVEAMERMVETVPEGIDSDGNLLVLPATQAGTLYGEQLERYHRHVAEFFAARLG